MNYIKNPKNIKALALELQHICDDYWTGKIGEVILKDYVHYVARNSKLLAENGKAINVTVVKIIGKKRLDLVCKMLSDYQLRLI